MQFIKVKKITNVTCVKSEAKTLKIIVTSIHINQIDKKRIAFAFVQKFEKYTKPKNILLRTLL